METARFGIRVNCVAPGNIEQYARTVERSGDDANGSDEQYRAEIRKLFPLGSVYLPNRGSADDIAEMVAFLASDAASHITGEVIYVAGGRRG